MSNSKVEPKKVLDTAKSVHKMIKAFNGMELSSSEEKDLGHQCLKLDLELHKEDTDLEKVLCYGKKALNILLSNQNCKIPCLAKHDRNPNRSSHHSTSLFMASILNMLGYACSKLKRYDESLSYLNWSERNLGKLESDTSCCETCFSKIFRENQLALYKVKFGTARREECPIHMKRILEIKERTLEAGCFELGVAYKDVADAYQLGYNFAEALPYQVKALEIYQRHLAQDSAEIVHLRRHLSVMYSEIGEYEKALELNQLCLSVLKNMDNNSELLHAMLEKGCMLIQLRRYEEAIDVIKTLVSHSAIQGGPLGVALQYLASANIHLGKYDVANKYLKSSLKIFDKLDINSHDQLQQEKNRIYFTSGLGDLARLYEKMNEFEPAMSLSWRVLAVPNLPQKLFLKISDRLFLLITKSCKGEQKMSSLEDLVRKLKDKFGPERLEVGYGYLRLGVAYLNSNIMDLASKNLAYAKDVLDVCLGPTHSESLQTNRTLALTYASMGSFDLAIELLENTIEQMKGLPSQQKFLDVAFRKLKLMKEKSSGEVAEYPTSVFPRSEHAEAKSSECGVSEDQKQPCSNQVPAEGNLRAGGKQAKSKRRGR